MNLVAWIVRWFGPPGVIEYRDDATTRIQCAQDDIADVLERAEARAQARQGGINASDRSD